MPIQDKVVTDALLVRYFKSESPKVRFIGRSRLKTRRLIAQLDPHHDLGQQRERLLELWRCLLGDAIVFLKKKDQREKYHDKEIFGVDDLYEYFKRMGKFEGTLYGTVPSYRDHITHTLRVFMLGEYVIRKAIGFGAVSCEDDQLNKYRIRPDEKEAMWAIIALCHDLGYPLESIHVISENAREMLEKFGRMSIQELAYGLSPQSQAIGDFVVRFIGSNLLPHPRSHSQRFTQIPRTSSVVRPYQQTQTFAVHEQPKYSIKFANALNECQHGIMSCLLIVKKLVYFLESDYTTDTFKFLDQKDAKQYLIRRIILRAIASHDCEEIYHLTLNNFPFLLLICDEMQDWGRPRLVELFERAVPSKLRIRTFDAVNVDYEIEFAKGLGKGSSNTEISDYFKKKKQKFIKVLRSAVGGKYRNLCLTFRVTDRTTRPLKKYRLEHPRPDKVKVYTP